jgi:hypothetical protein
MAATAPTTKSNAEPATIATRTAAERPPGFRTCSWNSISFDSLVWFDPVI